MTDTLEALQRDPAGLTSWRIKERLEREVEAMMLFALDRGIAVPPDLLVSLERALSCVPGGTEVAATGQRPMTAVSRAERTVAMLPVTAAEWTGSNEPPALMDCSQHISLLGGVHLALGQLVAPARPGTLMLLHDERRKHPFLHSFGAVPLSRKMLLLALLSLLLLLGAALSPDVNTENMAKGVLNLQGSELLVNEMFLAAAAMVGATLANLKRLDQFISARTYDECCEGSYWTRLMMGLLSGVILSQLILGTSVGTGAVANVRDAQTVLGSVGQPVLALLGGFSGELVHNILAHFIALISNLLGGDKSAPPAGDMSLATASRIPEN